MRQPKIIVVGGGLAGLMATIRVAEAGIPVDLFSIVPVKRSHSVCAQGGINAAKNQKGEGDTVDKHFDDTSYGGDFLANQPLVKRMCEAAPGIIDLLDRMGVMFNRTPEGLLDYRRFGGTLYHRTAFAGATTGQQLLYALDEQVRRHEAEGKVKKFEGATFLSAVIHGGGVCRGICAMDLRTMEIKTFAADAVIFATGGNGAIFGRSTNSVVCTGSAQAALFQQGVDYANGEFIQVHPTAIHGEDKLRLMSESARGEGGSWGNGENQASDVAGIYAAGECEYQYNGANRLGANSLVSCIVGGGIAGPAAVKDAKNLENSAESTPAAVFDGERKRQEEKNH